MRKLSKNASKEDVRISKNFNVSILKEAGMLMELESLWKKKSSPITVKMGSEENSISDINLNQQSKQLQRGIVASRNHSNLTAMTALHGQKNVKNVLRSPS